MSTVSSGLIGVVERLHLPLLLRILPTAVLVGSAWALAWGTGGSIEAPAWLPYAAGSALVLAALVLGGAAAQPRWPALAGVAALLGLAVWDAISLDWSPVPSLARDEALLVAFYAVALLTTVLTLRSDRERLAATVVVVAGLSALAAATAVELRVSDHPADLYWFGRLDFPITYPNAQAAMLLIGFWPAVGLAAGRSLPLVLRALALGGATAMLADWLLAQSKGGALGLAVSAIVFFAVCPSRLRALVPAAIAAVITGAAYEPLTEPFRASEAELPGAIHTAGTVAFSLAAGATLAGLVYALLDRHLRVSELGRRVAGTVVIVALLASLAGGMSAFFATVDRPGDYVADRWREWRHLPEQRAGSSHLTSLGSNRYDFWRVALDEFERHPAAGVGARGFGPAYLREGRSEETPARAHSVELDVMGETGVFGLLLLLAAGGFVFAAVAPRARTSLAGAALLATGAYWAAHTAVDWVWSFPAVGLTAFCLLGIGASSDGERPPPLRAALPAGIAAAALALFGFAPPWLSAKLTDLAYRDPQGAASDLRWARWFDPLSTDPLVAQAALAAPPANIPPLVRAVRKQPRRADLRYLLGAAYLDAGRKAEARRELLEALRLYPGDDLARKALRRAR